MIHLRYDQKGQTQIEVLGSDGRRIIQESSLGPFSKTLDFAWLFPWNLCAAIDGPIRKHPDKTISFKKIEPLQLVLVKESITNKMEGLIDLAGYLRSIAHIERLRIMQYLAESGKVNVSKLHNDLELNQAVASQHLSILRKNTRGACHQGGAGSLL